MWFAFPDNVEGISVELQEFKPEFAYKGVRYFRAPDHFAAKILDLPGFKQQSPPADANPPADIPRGEVMTADAQNASALAARVNALELERDDARVQLSVVSMERDQLKLRVHELESDVGELKEEIANVRKDLEAAQGKRK